MTPRILFAAAAIALLAANPLWAQTTVTTTTTTSSFDALSPGNQKIATALFNAQNTTGTTLTPLTQDQIADLKGKEGWGRVFKQMKTDGLIQAKNLGQVVSGHATATGTTSTTSTSNTTTSSRSTSARASSRTSTSRHGRPTTFASSRIHGHARFSSGRGFAAGPMAHGGGFGHAGGGFAGGGGFGGGHGGGGGHGR